MVKTKKHPIWGVMPLWHVKDVADDMVTQMDHEADYEKKLDSGTHAVNVLCYHCCDSSFILREEMSPNFLAGTPLRALLNKKVSRKYPQVVYISKEDLTEEIGYDLYDDHDPDGGDYGDEGKGHGKGEEAEVSAAEPHVPPAVAPPEGSVGEGGGGKKGGRKSKPVAGAGEGRGAVAGKQSQPKTGKGRGAAPMVARSRARPFAGPY